MKKYKSKIGLWTASFLAVIFCSTLYIMMLDFAWFGIIVIVVTFGFVLYTYMTTYYTINGNDLIIKCGFNAPMTIKIDTIKKIVEAYNLSNAPALSLDRLSIYYGESGFEMISPKDKVSFINDLKRVNEKIEVVLRKTN